MLASAASSGVARVPRSGRHTSAHIPERASPAGTNSGARVPGRRFGSEGRTPKPTNHDGIGRASASHTTAAESRTLLLAGMRHNNACETCRRGNKYSVSQSSRRQVLQVIPQRQPPVRNHPAGNNEPINVSMNGKAARTGVVAVRTVALG